MSKSKSLLSLLTVLILGLVSVQAGTLKSDNNDHTVSDAVKYINNRVAAAVASMPEAERDRMFGSLYPKPHKRILSLLDNQMSPVVPKVSSGLTASGSLDKNTLHTKTPVPQDKGQNVQESPTVPMKRKPGRPRKHPLPPNAGVIKTASKERVFDTNALLLDPTNNLLKVKVKGRKGRKQSPIGELEVMQRKDDDYSPPKGQDLYQPPETGIRKSSRRLTPTQARREMHETEMVFGGYTKKGSQYRKYVHPRKLQSPRSSPVF